MKSDSYVTMSLYNAKLTIFAVLIGNRYKLMIKFNQTKIVEIIIQFTNKVR